MDKTTYLNYQSTQDSFTYPKQHVLGEVNISLFELESVERRVVYGLLDLLGDLGGAYASLSIIGYLCHFLITGQEVEQ